MQFLSIGVTESDEDIIQHIRNELKLLDDKKISFSVDDLGSEYPTSIICSICDDKANEKKTVQSYDTLRVHISNILADYIIRRYEEKLIVRIINTNFGYFTNAEKKEILGITINIIKNGDKNILNSIFQIRRRNVIVRKLLDYFEGSNNLVLDGFVNFRLKDYIKDLEEIVDKAVDDYLMQREYREFIKLLRYFVDIQEPRYELIHVLSGLNNKYMLLDENQREITNECIQDFVNEIAAEELNFDDLLVSSLITLAPKKIIIHSHCKFQNKELLETIKNVFSGKVSICPGCSMCCQDILNNEQ